MNRYEVSAGCVGDDAGEGFLPVPGDPKKISEDARRADRGVKGNSRSARPRN
ncbi:MAG TPA: hypothetical protein V6D14_13710 [Coleofasciculaceae cyanobacterium]|jgi:hypothetical protein